MHKHDSEIFVDKSGNRMRMFSNGHWVLTYPCGETFRGELGTGLLYDWEEFYEYLELFGYVGECSVYDRPVEPTALVFIDTGGTRVDLFSSGRWFMTHPTDEEFSGFIGDGFFQDEDDLYGFVRRHGFVESEREFPEYGGARLATHYMVGACDGGYAMRTVAEYFDPVQEFPGGPRKRVHVHDYTLTPHQYEDLQSRDPREDW